MNNFINPIGSIEEQVKSFLQDVNEHNDDVTEIRGVGGKLRHKGSFSSDNPYLENLKLASTNQDKDALYEMAVKWEADAKNTDPSYLVSRQKEAGINPDVSGGSSSGSGSAVSGSIPQQQSTISTSNAYDNTNLVFSGLQSAAAMIGSFSSLGTSIVDGITKMQLLPAQVKLGDATAQMAETSADVAKETAGASISSAKSRAIDESLDAVGKLASFVPKDYTDEQAIPLLQASGLSKEDIDAYLPKLRAFHNSDAMQQYYAELNLSKRKASALNNSMTDEIIANVADFTAEAQRAQSNGNKHVMQLAERIATLQNTQEFAEKSQSAVESSLDSQIASNTTNVEQQKFVRMQLAQDVKAFVNYLTNLKNEISSVDKEIADFEKKHVFDRHLIENDGYIKALRVKKLVLMQCGSQSSNEFSNTINDFYYQQYMYNVAKGYGLQMFNLDSKRVSSYNIFSYPLFGKFANGVLTAQDIENSYLKVIDQALEQQKINNTYEVGKEYNQYMLWIGALNSFNHR